MLRFQLFGIPIEISPYFWLGSAILGSGAAHGDNAFLLLAVWIVCVLVSIIVHELGHALVGRHYGASPRITLHQLGGLTYLPGAHMTRTTAIYVSLAGPAAGYVLYALSQLALPRVYAAWEPIGTARLVLNSAYLNLVFINFYWTIFNLLPILPLDGGQVMRQLLGPGNFRAACLIGGVLAAACCVLAYMHGQLYTALLLGFLAFGNFQGSARSLPGGTAA